MDHPFDFEAVNYPAFVVVFGRSKQSITMYNRSTFDEHFACDVCQSPTEAIRLTEGYHGRLADLTVYVAEYPQVVGELLSNGISRSYTADESV